MRYDGTGDRRTVRAKRKQSFFNPARILLIPTATVLRVLPMDAVCEPLLVSEMALWRRGPNQPRKAKRTSVNAIRAAPNFAHDTIITPALKPKRAPAVHSKEIAT